MSSNKSRLLLEDSWVVADESESPEKVGPDTNPEFEEHSLPSTPSRKPSRKRLPRKATKSPEPQFFMPSLDNDTLSASMADSPRRRPPRSPLREDGYDARRRKPHRENTPPRSDIYVPRQPAPAATQQPAQDFLDFVVKHGGAMVSHTFDVVGKALHIIKTPIAYVVAVWFLFGILVIARNMLSTSLMAAVSPVCRIPLVSLLPIPFCDGVVKNGRAPPPAEFDQLMDVQMKFEDVMKQSAIGASLPGDMKRGEMSIRDLRTLVRASHIPSKQELILEFDGFVDTSQMASYDLQKFNSHVGRAVDTVLATTRWTARVLEDIRLADLSRGAIGGFLNNKVLAVFQPYGVMTESKLLTQYIKHAHIIEAEISRLVTEAQALLAILNNLEDRLELIHSLVIRDGAHANAKRQEILSELWTMLGGNKQRLSQVGSEMDLLKHVNIYRQKALAHVTDTLVRLEEIGSGIEDLRERVATPRVLGNQQLPLSIHIENIILGVGRLEEGRNQAKQLEVNRVRRVLDGGDQDGDVVLLE